MKKKKIIAVLLAVAIVVVGSYFLFFNKKSINGQVKEIKADLTSYHSEATMEMFNGEDSRQFSVVTCYQKGESSDKFRVSMLDKVINQEQIILRNENGVYVLTPSLNQVHQFKGDWPLNSPKPYLYHSLLELFGGPHKLKKVDLGYQLSAKDIYKNTPGWHRQEVLFSKELKPLTVNISNEAGDNLVKITFTKFETGVEFAADHFNLDANMQKAREDMTAVTGKLEDLPLYPVNSTYPANLVSQTLVSVEGSDYHVLNYQGQKAFTIIQKVAPIYTQMNVVSINNGQIVELFNGSGYYASNMLAFTYNGIEYRITSTDMVLAELIDVANGMDIVVTRP